MRKRRLMPNWRWPIADKPGAPPTWMRHLTQTPRAVQGRDLKVVYGTLVENQAGLRPVWIFIPQVRAGALQEETLAALGAQRRL